MITGDNPLTACHVSKELKITSKKVLVLTHDVDVGFCGCGANGEGEEEEEEGREGEWVWQSVDKGTTIPAVPTLANPSELGKKFDLCVTGEVSSKCSLC